MDWRKIYSQVLCQQVQKREIEEERRLLYVAITRAERHCILTNAKNRFRYGSMQVDNPSRFLMIFDPALIHVEDEANSTFGGERRKMPWDEDNSSRNAWGRNRSEDNSVSTNQTRHTQVADLGDKNIVKWARDGRIQILLQANFVLIQSQR